MIERLRKIYHQTRRDLAENGGAPVALDARTVMVLVVTSVLLTLFYYYGRPDFYSEHLEKPLLELLEMKKSPYEGLLRYWYWAFSSVVLRILIPLACILFWFRESPREYGFRMWKKGHGLIYFGLYLFMLPVLIVMSFNESFQAKYPFYDAAGDSWIQFVLYEPSYLVQFISLEAFFRGFLVFALFRRFGYHGVAIMTVPYCMIHFGKPAPEALGAIVAGLALGFLAVKSRSWIPGALLHFGVGFTMDIVCILQKSLNG